VRVRITREGPGSRGRITLGKGDRRGREVDGPTCGEVVAALALITALRIDPAASLAPRPPPPDPPAPPAPLPPSPPAPPVLPQWPAPVAPPLASPPPPRIPAAPIAAPAAPRGPGFRWSIGAHASAAFGVAPGVLVGGGPFVEIRPDTPIGLSIRLAAEVAATGTLDLGPGSAHFLRGIGWLDACAALLRPARWLSLAPCLGVEGGFLRGQGLPGQAVSVTRQVVVPWAGLGFLARAVLSLGDRVRLDLQGGPEFPLVRRSFVFDAPTFLVHEVPPVTGIVRLGAGVSFW
jgi:hypothetical protein